MDTGSTIYPFLWLVQSCIAIINQLAYHGKGRTILTSSQMETFGLQVHNQALRTGGRQCIKSANGYFMPLIIIDNLVYTPLRIFSYEQDGAATHFGGHMAIQQPRLGDRC